jgi:protein-S-isoprenylcysteine O-methyltransferase Ste14
MRRVLGIAAGVVSHALFAWTACRLYGFLKGGSVAASGGALALDFLLAAQFGLLHSALLHPAVRDRLTGWISPFFYGLFYCCVTCAQLLLLFAFWQRSPTVWWELTGMARGVVNAGWFLSWGALLYSLWATGPGYQTGWTPWWHWLRGQPLPVRSFIPRGPFRLMRHPIYLSFLGLIWLTPVMTADRAILTSVWTVYILIGSYLKDERLAYYMRDNYRAYQARVAGYPGMPAGFLGKLPVATAVTCTTARVASPAQASPPALHPASVPCSLSH